MGSATVIAVAWLVGGTLEGKTTAPTSTTSTPGNSTSPSGAASVSGTFDGATESTRYGTVQVKIVVVAGKITDVVATKLTDQGGRSVQISNRAAPILRAEVIKAQSAKVSSVSGATYTARGYLSSVQSALDKAGL
ncbi:FMN-binding protein [Lacisediminihabitans changchengi]|uniref:FMN-binding protein n=1 Tax=Lacisediminihabitans changchengi TaxID=2787634 RepID=UPI0027DE1CE2|nr:FMN-binding protein [Lacisediminihabitans changchengi]